MDTSPPRGPGRSGSKMESATISSGQNSPRTSQRTLHNGYNLSGSDEERKHGYDVELFLDNVSASPYLCCVCMNVVEDCHETTCGHIFCGPCIKRALSSDSKFRCPIDRTTNVELHPSRFVNRAVLNLQVKCPNHHHGCSWQGPLKDLIDKHSSSSSKSMSSSSSSLSSETPRSPSHPEEEKKKNKNKQQPGHIKTCAYGFTICDNCGIRVARMNYEEHRSKCPMASAVAAAATSSGVSSTCSFCIQYVEKNKGYKSISSSSGGHVEKCPLFLMVCPDGCESTMKREDLSRHLSEDCRERIVSCPYSSFGCSATIKLKHIQNHLKYNASAHLQMKMDHACEDVMANKVTIDNLCKQIENLTMNVDVLATKLETLQKKSSSPTTDLTTATETDVTSQQDSGTGIGSSSSAPDVLILRGNNTWEVTGIFIRRSKFHAGRVCYTLTHGPCAIRWHPSLCAWLIDRRGLKYDQEASLIAYEDVSHPGLVHAPWYVFHADQHQWIESESYRVESCNLAELFFKAETICPEFFINPMTPSAPPTGTTTTTTTVATTGGGATYGLPRMNGEPEIFVDDLVNVTTQHRHPPGLGAGAPTKENGNGAAGSGMDLLENSMGGGIGARRSNKKSWRKLEVDFQ